MKFYSVVQSWETRAFRRTSRWSKTHPFAMFCLTVRALHSIVFSQPWRKSCKIPGFFASWNFHYSNEGLKPTTACVIVRKEEHIWNRYRTNKLSFYRRHACFCNLCARAALHQDESTRKTKILFSHLKHPRKPRASTGRQTGRKLGDRKIFLTLLELAPQGVLPCENDGVVRRKFSKTPLKSTRIWFCGRGFEFIYTPKRYQF